MVIRSYAKINLYLEILRKRPDGYHEIKSIFERISLYDTLILKPRKDTKIKISSSSKKIPLSRSNLAYQAADLLIKEYNIPQGVDIGIIKRIPVASGLGGGSSNAASVLMGLNKLWKLNIPLEKLSELASQIGSDVPFFVQNCPFALIKGRGERVKELKNLKSLKLWHILVVPDITVSTASIYKEWQGLKAQLTRHKTNDKILQLALYKKDIAKAEKYLFNTLEWLTFRKFPKTSEIRNKIAVITAKRVLMSGSGPAIFFLVPSRKEAVVFCRQLKSKGFKKTFAVETC